MHLLIRDVMKIIHIFSYTRTRATPFVILALCGLLSCVEKPEPEPEPVAGEPFTFLFMTDIHVGYLYPTSFDGLQLALTKAESIAHDFIVLGGDNVEIDRVTDETEVRDTYQRLKEILNQYPLTYKPSIGNHDRCWLLTDSDTEHGTSMYRDYFGDTYYTYEHKGVHFIHLNNCEVCDTSYCVSEKQKNWLKETLDGIDKKTPLVLVVHIPFVSSLHVGTHTLYRPRSILEDYKDIWALIKNHNLIMVLQGHMHIYEEIQVFNTNFVTGGAVSGSWWGAYPSSINKGFLIVNWDGKDMHCEYIRL